MTTLNIEGKRVKVSDDFMRLSPEEQAKTVDEIAAQMGIQKAPKEQSWGDFATGVAGQAAQGLTFGFFDEGLAAGASALGVNNYQENLRRIRGFDKQFTDANPGTSLAANIAGGLVTGGGVARLGERALGVVAPGIASAVSAGTAGVPGRIAAGAAGGVAGGALAGAGTAQGGAQDTAYGALQGAALGGMIGGAIPGAGAALKGAGEAALRTMPWLRDIRVAGYQPFTSADDRASEVLGQTLARGEIASPQAQSVSQAVRGTINSGAGAKDTVLADVTPELQGLGGAVARSSGAGSAQARDFLRIRQEGLPLAGVPGQGGRLADDIAGVGGKMDLRATVSQIVEDRSAAARPLFDKVRAVGEIDSDFLKFAIQDGRVRSIIAKAASEAKLAGDLPADFKLSFKKPLPAALWMKVKEAFDDVVGAAVRKGENASARNNGRFVSSLIDEIDNLTGGAYRPALDDFAGRSALLNAAQFGEEAARKAANPQKISDLMGQMKTQGEIDLFRQGYKAALMQQAQAYPRKGDAAYAKILNNDAKVAEIRAVFGQDADEILRAATVRQAQAGTYQQLGGSQTQPRMMAEDDLESAVQSGAGFLKTVGLPGQSLSGRVNAAYNYLFDNLSSRVMSERVRNRLAEQLFSPDPAKVQSALKAAEAAAKSFMGRNKALAQKYLKSGAIAGGVAQQGNLAPGLAAGASAAGQALSREQQPYRGTDGKIVYPANWPKYGPQN